MNSSPMKVAFPSLNAAPMNASSTTRLFPKRSVRVRKTRESEIRTFEKRYPVFFRLTLYKTK